MKKIALALIALAASLALLAANPAKSDYILMEALAAHADGRNADCQALMERAYRLNPNPASVAAKYVSFYRLGHGLASNDSAYYHDALQIAYGYVQNNPDDTYAAYSLASQFAYTGRFDLALPLAQRVDSLMPGSGEPARLHAAILANMGRADEAADVYRRVMRVNGRSAPITYELAKIHINLRGDTLAALSEIDSLYISNPTDPETLNLAASTYALLASPSDALELINRSIATAPDATELHQFRIDFASDYFSPDTVFDLTMKSLQNNSLTPMQREEVLQQYVRHTNPTDSADIALRLKAADYLIKRDDSTWAYTLRAVINTDAENYAEASADMLRLAERNTDASDAYYAEGLRLMTLNGEGEKAEKLAIQALNGKYKASQDLKHILALIYLAREDYDKAIKVNTEIVNDTTADNNWRSLIAGEVGDILAGLDRHDQAIDFYEQAITLDSLNLMPQNNLAYLLACQNRDLDHAAVLIFNVINLDSRAIYLDTAAWVEYARGNYEKAREYITEALANLQSVTDGSELLLHAGDIYFRLGDEARALDFWQQALDQDPDNEELQQRVTLKKIPE